MTAEPFTPGVAVPPSRPGYVEVVVQAQRELWDRATVALAAGDDDEAGRLFQEANDLGAALPLDEGQVCCLTGRVAAGSARPPGYPWETPLRLSHGRDERWPTALQRWCGYVDPGGHYHPPERPTLRVAVRQERLVAVMASADPSGPRQGGEALRGLLGLRKGSRLRVEYRADGVVELHPEMPVRPTGED